MWMPGAQIIPPGTEEERDKGDDDGSLSDGEIRSDPEDEETTTKSERTTATGGVSDKTVSTAEYPQVNVADAWSSYDYYYNYNYYSYSKAVDSQEESQIEQRTNVTFENKYDPNGPCVDYYVPWYSCQSKYDRKPYYRPFAIMDDAEYMFDWDFGEPFKEEDAPDSELKPSVAAWAKKDSRKYSEQIDSSSDESESSDDKSKGLRQRGIQQLIPSPIPTLCQPNESPELYQQCIFCGRMFLELMAFDIHVRHVHGEQSVNQAKRVAGYHGFGINCEVCPSNFRDSGSYFSHLATEIHIANLAKCEDWEKTGYSLGEPAPVPFRNIFVNKAKVNLWWRQCLFCARRYKTEVNESSSIKDLYNFASFKEFTTHIVSSHYPLEDHFNTELYKLLYAMLKVSFPEFFHLAIPGTSASFATQGYLYMPPYQNSGSDNTQQIETNSGNGTRQAGSKYGAFSDASSLVPSKKRSVGVNQDVYGRTLDDSGYSERSSAQATLPTFQDMTSILQNVKSMSGQTDQSGMTGSYSINYAHGDQSISESRKQEIRATGMTALLKQLYSGQPKTPAASTSTAKDTTAPVLDVFQQMQKTIYKVLEHAEESKSSGESGGVLKASITKLIEKLFKDEFQKGTEMQQSLVDRVVKDYVQIRATTSSGTGDSTGPAQILDPKKRATEEEKAQLTVLIRRHADELRTLEEVKNLAKSFVMSSSESESEGEEENVDEANDTEAQQKRKLFISYGVILDSLAPGAIQTDIDNKLATDIIIHLSQYMFNIMNCAGKSNTISLQEKYQILGQLKGKYGSEHALLNAAEYAICVSLDIVKELLSLDITSLQKLPALLTKQAGLPLAAFQDVSVLQDVIGANFPPVT